MYFGSRSRAREGVGERLCSESLNSACCTGDKERGGVSRSFIHSQNQRHKALTLAHAQTILYTSN